MVITAVANLSPQGPEGLGKAGAACDSLDAAVEKIAAMGSSLLQSYCEIVFRDHGAEQKCRSSPEPVPTHSI